MMMSDEEDEGSVIVGFVFMLVLSILLFWLPLLGPLVAGFVGGRKAGSVGNGILAALLPALVIGVIVTFGFGLISPIIGAILGGTMFVVVGIQSFILLIGAIIGGATA